jgi:beta-glucosidase
MKLAYRLSLFFLIGMGHYSLAEDGNSKIENGPFSSSSMLVKERIHEGVLLKTNFLPNYAFDGDENTRWESIKRENQWLIVDFQKKVSIASLDLSWGSAYAKSFELLVSSDKNNWISIFTAEDIKEPKVLTKVSLNEKVEARYLKVLCKERGSNFGFSIHEIKINGMSNAELTLPSVPKDAPYKNANLDPKLRAKDLISRMTFEEKMRMTGGVDHMYINALKRFDIPRVRVTDASAGIRIKKGTPNPIDTTAFPSPTALAASWDPEIAYNYAQAIGEECRAFGYSVLLGPGVNIYRVSQNGRNFEYYGEDPYLASRTVVGYVNGLQSQGILATVKHFIADNQEFIRHDYNAVIDDRTMHEIYLPAFKAAIHEADAKAIMTAYNYVNGEDAGDQKEIIKKLLRDEIGFEGIVMTDWGGYENHELVLKSGQNLMMPSNRRFEKFWNKHIRENPEDSAMVEKEIERMAFRILSTLFEMGVYDREPYNAEFVKKFPSHKEVARKTAEAGITLLKNNKGFLPLNPKNYQRVLFCGDDQKYAGGGSATVKGYDQVSYLSGLKNIFGESKVTYIEKPNPEQIKNADLIICRTLNHGWEGSDTPFAVKDKTASLCVDNNENTVVLAAGGKGMSMPWLEKAQAVLATYYLGQEAGNAIGNIMTGKVNPSGKLPYTIEEKFEDSFAYGYNYLEETGKYHMPAHADKIEKDLKPGKSLDLPKDIVYEEGIFVGYRWYDREKIEPRFPFGYGLSYTTFHYSDLKIESSGFKDDLIAQVSLNLKNTGSRAGAEVVQLYVQDPECSVERPIQELKGFKKVFLKPGESKKMTFNLKKEDLAFWEVNNQHWKAEEGLFNIRIGTSSRGIHLNGSFELKETLIVGL